MAQTLEEIRRNGLDALRKRLRKAGMIRFLQQFEAGAGDYSKERHEWLPAGDVKDLASRIRASRKPQEDPENDPA